MRTLFHLAPSLLVLSALCLTVPLTAGEQKIVLREHLGLQWNHELLTYPLTFREGECIVESVWVSGPRGPIYSQLTDVESWPGTKYVKAAKLAFVTDLAPLATDEYTVYFGTKPGGPVYIMAPPPPDLTITPGEASVEITTSRFGLRLLLGEKTFDPPVDASQVPGPVLALRAAGNTWYGGSRMYGPGKITGYSARLVDNGPALARARIAYQYEGGRTAELIVALAEHGGHATWDMSVTPYDRQLAAHLTAGAGWAEAEKLAADSAAREGFDLLLSPGLTAPQLKLRPFPPDGTAGMQARWGGLQRDKYGNPLPDPVVVDVTAEPAGEVLRLMPWAGWWNQMDMTSFVYGTTDQPDLLFVATRDGGDWVEPAPLGTWSSYGNVSQRHKWVPLMHGDDGSLYLRFSAAPGLRRWQTGVVEALPQLNPYAADLSNYVIPAGMWPLDRVKDLVLDWPQDAGSHPRLFFSAADLNRTRQTPPDPQYVQELRDYVKTYKYVNVPTYRDPNALTLWLLTGSREYAQEAELVERLRTYLGNLGRMDRMRGASQLACMYDGLADSGLLTPEQRKLFQAQMAFLAYLCADPGNWSMERGFASGNQNMSVAHVLNLGMLAATLPEHPLAQQWSAPALFMMEKWLKESVGPQGEWPESLANYAEVSVSMLVVYAVAAKRAGVHDFFADPRFQRLLLYLGKHYTPPDPRPFRGRTAPLMGSPPSGRGPAYHPVTGIFGLAAKALAVAAPDLSATFQWLWLRGGKSAGYISDRMGGLETVATDPALPARAPLWTSERFPLMDVLLRQGVGSPQEYYANLVMDPKGYTAYYSENGGFAAIWARGAPTTVRFAGHGYGEREEILTSRVLLARQPGDVAERTAHFMYSGPMSITGFSALPRQDYVQATLRYEKPVSLWHSPDAQEHLVNMPRWPSMARPGAPPLDWQRQVLFAKGNDATEAGYFIFRDTVTGGQPTTWQFWTLSEKIGTPEQVRDLGTFLADKPGDKAVDARELKGDRFTAVGQQGVDVEYYIAAPTDTPRHTLRWGHAYYHYYTEYQDLLHLQLPGDGAYFVAYYPRLRAEPVPAFATLGEGKIIKVSGDWGADYGFLSAEEATAEAEGAAFRGTVGSVQNRKSGVVLSLGAPGMVRFGDRGVSSQQPVSVRVQPDALVVDLASDHAAGEIGLQLPGAWKLYQAPAGVKLQKAEGDYLLTVPEGVAQVRLAKG